LFAAITWNEPTLFFSIEMSANQITARLVSSRLQIPLSNVKSGNMNDYELDDFYNYTKNVSENKPDFWINEAQEQTGQSIRAICKRVKRSCSALGLVVVDYLQLTGSDDERKGLFRNQDVASATKSLKKTAQILDVPIIALAQMSRAVDARVGHVPCMSDLGESAVIEHTADAVIFIHNPDRYAAEPSNAPVKFFDLIVAKNRDGRIGAAKVGFRGEYCQFTNIED
jgi:replicative DNA helicase